MRIKVFNDKEYVTLQVSFTDWLKLQFGYPIYHNHLTRPGWTGKLPFYILKCRRHDYYLAYPGGFEGYNQGFNCPFCLEELKK